MAFANTGMNVISQHYLEVNVMYYCLAKYQYQLRELNQISDVSTSYKTIPIWPSYNGLYNKNYILCQYLFKSIESIPKVYRFYCIEFSLGSK